MKICVEKVLNLNDGEHLFDFDTPGADVMPDAVNFEGEHIFDEMIRTHVRLQKTGHTYYVKLQVGSRARLVCDRCLVPLRIDVDGSYQIVYTDLKDRNDEDSEEWRHFDPRKANEIVLDKEVQDTLVLAMPQKALCREDCKGLCPDCGVNLNDELCSHERARLESQQ